MIAQYPQVFVSSNQEGGLLSNLRCSFCTLWFLRGAGVSRSGFDSGEIPFSQRGLRIFSCDVRVVFTWRLGAKPCAYWWSKPTCGTPAAHANPWFTNSVYAARAWVNSCSWIARAMPGLTVRPGMTPLIFMTIPTIVSNSRVLHFSLLLIPIDLRRVLWYRTIPFHTLS